MEHQGNRSRVLIYIQTQHPLVRRMLSRIVAANPDWHVADAMGTVLCKPRHNLEGLMIIDACLAFSLSSLVCGAQPGMLRTILLQPAHLQNPTEELRVLLLGISGIVYASSSLEEELPKAIDAVLQGTLWVSRQVLTEYLRRTSPPFVKSPSSPLNLTLREEQIFWLLTKGVSNKKIGAALGISERTVKFHVSNILYKHRVTSRRALVSQYGKGPAVAEEPLPLAKIS